MSNFNEKDSTELIRHIASEHVGIFESHPFHSSSMLFAQNSEVDTFFQAYLLQGTQWHRSLEYNSLLARNGTIGSVASRANSRAASVVVSWALIRSWNAEHVREISATAGTLRLDVEDLQAIDALDASLPPKPN